MRNEPLWVRLRPPLWARWALSLLVAAGLMVALIAFVHRHNDNGLAHVSTAAEERADREAAVVVGQDQAPHVVRLAAGGDAAAGVVAAVRADVRRRIAQGSIAGTLHRVACRRTGTRGTQTAYRCVATASQVAYPYLALAEPARGRVTYCKRDLPPTPTQDIPVSRRCRL